MTDLRVNGTVRFVYERQMRLYTASELRSDMIMINEHH